MNHYNAYLFDWDGTLARSLEVWLDSIYQQCEKYGVEVTREENARHFGDLEWPLLYGLPKHRLSEFIADSDAAAQKRLPDVPLYDDAKTLLETLHAQGKKVGLVTTSLRRNLEVVIGKHSVRDLFDVIITSEDVTRHKPDPEGIQKALSQLAIAPSRAVFLGDTAHDMLAARHAGIDSALFYPELHELIYDAAHLQAHAPTYTIHAWSELLDQLQ
ncbi:MAG TPA: HAD family hydrolase [Candidatus Saccharimonadales bacterium]|nr:HAD family hydrolase [Candidatus Saccharimonadales bacterium]